MSKFEEWFKGLNENGKTVYFLGNEGTVSKMAWDHQQVEIDELHSANVHLLRTKQNIQKRVHDLEFSVRQFLDVLGSKYPEHKKFLPALVGELHKAVGLHGVVEGINSAFDDDGTDHVFDIRSNLSQTTVIIDRQFGDDNIRQRFESFFQSQSFYLQQKYIHGDRLFDFDEGIGYRNLTVQIGFVCFCKEDKEFVI